MASGLELWRAGATDTSLLHAMLQELAEATGHSGAISGTPKDLLKYGFGDDPRFFAVLATVDGGNAGMLLAFPEYSSWRGCPGIYVQDLYVRKEYRSLGIGHALLAEAAREAARMGGSAIARAFVDGASALLARRSDRVLDGLRDLAGHVHVGRARYPESQK